MFALRIPKIWTTEVVRTIQQVYGMSKRDPEPEQMALAVKMVSRSGVIFGIVLVLLGVWSLVRALFV